MGDDGRDSLHTKSTEFLLHAYAESRAKTESLKEQLALEYDKQFGLGVQLEERGLMDLTKDLESDD